jgi:hypothetical protein
MLEMAPGCYLGEAASPRGFDSLSFRCFDNECTRSRAGRRLSSKQSEAGSTPAGHSDRCDVRLLVRSPASHAGETGSTPVRRSGPMAWYANRQRGQVEGLVSVGSTPTRATASMCRLGMSVSLPACKADASGLCRCKSCPTHCPMAL